jgi:hypothetical protein
MTDIAPDDENIKSDVESEDRSDHESDLESQEEVDPLLVDIHGLTAKVYLDKALEILACEDCMEKTQQVLCKS